MSKQSRKSKQEAELAFVADEIVAPVPKAIKKRTVPVQTERKVTAVVWGRGTIKTDPLMRAFVSEHQRQRIEKRPAREWLKLFKAWVKKPRG